MDSLDLAILKILLVNNGVPPGVPVLRKSFRSIARDLGVDQGTIRSRIRRFQEKGVLKGWYLGVSPGLTAHNVGHAWLEVDPESEKSSVIESLLSVPEVERVCSYFGPKLSLVLLVPQDTNQDSTMKKLARLAGPTTSFHRAGVVDVPARVLKETDNLIIGSLRKDPWKPYPTVAEEVGVSFRTVARRVARLSEAGAVYLLPIVDLKAVEGIIPMELVIEYASPSTRARVNANVISYLRHELLFSDTTGPFGYFALMVPNLSRMEQVSKWANQQDGVRGARGEALQDVILNQDHYRRWRVPGRTGIQPSRR